MQLWLGDLAVNRRNSNTLFVVTETLSFSGAHCSYAAVVADHV